MSMDRALFRQWLYDDEPHAPFLRQESVRQNVCLHYADVAEEGRVELLLSMQRSEDTPKRVRDVGRRLAAGVGGDDATARRLAISGDVIAVALTLPELLTEVVPLTGDAPILTAALTHLDDFR